MDSGSISKMTSRANGSLTKLIRILTSFPGFALSLRERTLIAAGHVNLQDLGANKSLPHGRVVKYKIVAVVRKTQNTLLSLQAREALL